MGALGDMMVLVDFHGQQEDELNIKAGEIIRNVKKTPEDGWLEGDINGKRGFFPQIFAKEIPSVFLNDNGQRYPRSIRRVNAGVQKKKPRWCKADYSYTPGNADELELCVGEVYEILEEIEDGWWLGKKGNLMGAFPSNFVQEIEASPSEKVPEVKKNGKHRPKLMDLSFTPVDDKMLSDKPEDKPGVNQQKAAGQVTSVPTIQEFCRVMFDYTPSMQDELALKKGDVVSVVSKDNEDEGWWRGELNGKTGLFPDNFVILLPPTSQIKSNKPPTRTLTVKGPAKVNAPSADQIRPFVNGLVAPSSSDQKDITTTEKKHPEMKRPESPASAGHKAVKPEKVTVDKKVQDVNRPVSPASVAQKDAKADPVPKLSHFPAKRSAPAPPVPVKGKHGVNRPTTEYSSKPSEDGKGKNKDSNTLDGLRISSVKLAHPTAERPKVQGRRMPKTKNLPEPVSVMEEEQVNSHIKSPTSAKAAPKFSTSPNQATFQNTKSGTQSPSLSTSCKQMTDPAHTAQVEELAAEIKSVKLMMEILKNKHLKDMEEIRGEISEERIKRLALQMEIESLKRFSSS